MTRRSRERATIHGVVALPVASGISDEPDAVLVQLFASAVTQRRQAVLLTRGGECSSRG
jgi:hypothetical protein